MLEKLRKQHAQLRDLNKEVLALLSSEVPCDREALADARWRLVRTQLQHLALEQRCVYGPLSRDPEPRVSTMANAFIKEWETAFAGIQEHSNQWTPDRIEADWANYVKQARKLIEYALDRMDREETILYPLVKDHAPIAERAPDDPNWAGNAREIRDHIQTLV